MFDTSVGIMAYNEAGNVGRLLASLMSQKLATVRLKEICVVASGCTDRTEEIVREFTARDDRIRLLVQPKREGKASAINLFLAQASGDVLVLESGDTVPGPDCLERLVAPFADPRVGMTGAHPVPVNEPDNFVGYAVWLLWSLHHIIALEAPKLGEMVAFRNIVQAIPTSTAVDEAYLETAVREAGYELRYAPDAIVQNKGPENLRDFIKQRRRIAAGHIHLMRHKKYKVSTFGATKICKALARTPPRSLNEVMWTIGTILLESSARLLGFYDCLLRNRNPYIWEVAHSTKTWN